MSDETKKVVNVFELSTGEGPLGQFMELACKRMTMEMAHETSKWDALQQLEQLVETQRDELRVLRKQYEKLENTVDTLFKVMGGGPATVPRHLGT